MTGEDSARYNSEDVNQTMPTYQRMAMADDDDAMIGRETHDRTDVRAAHRTLLNFVFMSILFSANHASVVACLALATARLGATGAWQSGILYLTYTGSAIMGATYVVKKLGARNSLIAGMLLYCCYVGCFWLATVWTEQERAAAYIGAAIGGVGAGFLWTAQGAYFSKASEEHARQLDQSTSLSTSYLAGIFAFIYLGEEVLLRSLSTLVLEFSSVNWSSIFGTYSLLTIVSTAGMVFIHKYPDDAPNEAASAWFKISAAGRLLSQDPKMKYMIGLNAAFGFTSAFLNSYVNGEVVRVVLDDTDSKYIGALTAWLSGVAAIMSLVFGKVTQKTGKGPILTLGALCFCFVALPFLIQPDLQRWNGAWLILIYTLHGTGRATFEGTLKATFADYFSYEKEGAFANIILQNGLSSAIGYVLTFNLLCSEPSRYCAEFRDGTLHDVFSFELLVVATSLLAIAGFWRASMLYNQEGQNSENSDVTELLENEQGIST
ncbi:predicted protein [Phaeodactylum tricornutum CCAP 1055/1]|jgi:MFS family permease|uniref:Uncharacterized protein n=2 Tax=Phaeodactylum tricornutum TaxID=2850 RepID=B7G1G3_PHATC|nr:predicted protein [Phaeodactylum tricornutum CCAP 1055/1]EEC47504.1 predicted protein [Phaeodactylum tricornutum CCAP 1055/1]|eukprot:XP_002180852.1 predicted protein [Phaeodactylum tricornutum CCAP 1055/1]